MTGEPLVSVVVPTYNGARYLRATLDSLHAQTHPAVEVVVVDDGSSDSSVEIATQHPVKPIVVSQRNAGVAVARNRGLALARGEWVGFIDQDDLWHQDRIRVLLGLAERTGKDVVATTELKFAHESDREALVALGDGRDTLPSVWLADGGENAFVTSELTDTSDEVDEITLERFLEGAATVTTAMLYRRELAISAGGCAPHARALDDHVLNLNVARLAGPIPRIRSNDLFYRVHSASTSTISPMVAPFLSTQAAVRLGGVFPRDHHIGHNVENLLFGVAKSDLSFLEQFAILVLNTPRKTRARWLMRWLARRLGIR